MLRLISISKQERQLKRREREYSQNSRPTNRRSDCMFGPRGETSSRGVILICDNLLPADYMYGIARIFQGLSCLQMQIEIDQAGKRRWKILAVERRVGIGAVCGVESWTIEEVGS